MTSNAKIIEIAALSRKVDQPVLTVLRQDAPKTNGDAHPSSR
jgi:hypothetical protein